MVRLSRSSVAALAIIGLLMPAGTLLAAKGKRAEGIRPSTCRSTPPSPAQLAIIADQKDISPHRPSSPRRARITTTPPAS